MPHYMVKLHALLNLIFSFTVAFNNNKIILEVFELRVSVHRGLMNKIPTRCSNSIFFLFSFVLCSTCFGGYNHPSSGASTVHSGMV
jgi:hypothetical protein